nr:DUF2147 domain-containing protein [Sphingosinicella microcystinivorans]
MRSVLVSMMLLAAPAAAQNATLSERTYGTWQNPKNSVHVEARECDGKMCGVVVWASDKAKADARRGGTDQLIGRQLFQDFEEQQEGRWKGKVFVPDINRTFHGTVTIIDADTLEGKGCLLGGIGCKSQVWTRVK